MRFFSFSCFVSLEELFSYILPYADQIAESPMIGVEMDVQIGQMTLRSKHLAALPSSIANHADVKSIFGDATIQASLVERAENRQIYRLVGVQHELVYWPTAHVFTAPMDDLYEREYDPAELYDSERWIVNVSLFSFSLFSLVSAPVI